MINFSTLQGLTIPEGVVTQIADASGRVLWKPANDVPIVLEVAKQSITSYAGETSYSDNCVLLDIYPKTASSTVKVTYGGLTKTLSFSGTNAQQVYFGTFNGVVDETETPASGTLTIDGGCSGFACGVYQSDSKITAKNYCSCITGVTSWGGVTSLADHAFDGCVNLELSELPDCITSIGVYAFEGCTGLTNMMLHNGITTIGTNAFAECTGLYSVTLPNGIDSIPNSMFNGCTTLASIDIPFGVTSIGSYAFASSGLASVNIPDGVTSIGSYAFNNCGSLMIVTIPDSVTSIGSYGFRIVADIGRTVNVLADTPPVLEDGTVFDNVGNQNLVVKAGRASVYKSAEYWSEYANYITEAS